MSIDKVVIQGAEFTRVGERYLLQTEVELALARSSFGSLSHIERLTRLLDDMVAMADRMTVELAGQSGQRQEPVASLTVPGGPDESRAVLVRLRATLQEQIALIDRHLNRHGDR